MTERGKSDDAPAAAQASAEIGTGMIALGKKYLFHTHLGIWLGVVVEIDASEVVLNQCSWIAEQGRMGTCVLQGVWTRNEFVGDGIIVPRGGITVPWRWPLPTTSR